jgi:mycofactocin precursor
MAEVAAPVIEQEAQTPTVVEPSGPTTDDALVAEELLVEEISIDGMCGVY